eukprot:CFRG7817T1
MMGMVRDSLFSLFCHVLILSGAAYGAGERVQVLTEENFDKRIEHGIWIVEFYAPWCGHCKKLEPMFETAAKLMYGKVSFGKVDCTVASTISSRYQINGYPTIKALGEAGEHDYRGERSIAALVKFGEELAAPSITDYATSLNYRGEGKPVFILVGGTIPDRQVYAKVANSRKLGTDFSYFHVPKRPSQLGIELMNMLDLTPGEGFDEDGERKKLVVVSDGLPVEYTGDWVYGDIAAWVDRVSMGYLPQIRNGQKGTFKWSSLKQPNRTAIIAVLSIVDRKEPSSILMDTMKTVCKDEYRRTSRMTGDGGQYYQCMWMHGPEQAEMLRLNFGLDSINGAPLVFAINTDIHHYFYDDDPSASAADVRDFVERLKLGDVNAHGGVIDRLIRVMMWERPVLVCALGIIVLLVVWALYNIPDLDESDLGELTEAETALRDAIMSGSDEARIQACKKDVYEERAKHGGRPITNGSPGNVSVKDKTKKQLETKKKK